MKHDDRRTICHDCGPKLCNGWPEGHIASWWHGVCEFCGKEDGVTDVRDYGYLTVNNRREK